MGDSVDTPPKHPIHLQMSGNHNKIYFPSKHHIPKFTIEEGNVLSFFRTGISLSFCWVTWSQRTPQLGLSSGFLTLITLVGVTMRSTGRSCGVIRDNGRSWWGTIWQSCTVVKTLQKIVNQNVVDPFLTYPLYWNPPVQVQREFPTQAQHNPAPSQVWP